MQSSFSDWFTVSRLPAIVPAFDLNIWKLMRQMSLGIKYFTGCQMSSTEKSRYKKANSVSYLQKKYKKFSTMPSKEQEKSHKVRNEIIQLYISVTEVSLKNCTNSNIKVEILGIHEDYVTTPIFTLILLNGLLVLVAPNFRNRKKCQKQNLMFLWRFSHVREEERWHLSYQKFIDEIHLRATSDRFLRWTPLNKPFSIISDPAVTVRHWQI